MSSQAVFTDVNIFTLNMFPGRILSQILLSATSMQTSWDTWEIAGCGREEFVKPSNFK